MADAPLREEAFYELLPVLHDLFRELWLDSVGVSCSPFRFLVMQFAAGRCWTPDRGFTAPRHVHNTTGPLKWACRAFLWMEWFVLDIHTERGGWPAGFPAEVKSLTFSVPRVDAQPVTSMTPLLDFIYTTGGSRQHKSMQAPFHAVVHFNGQAKAAAAREVLPPTCSSIGYDGKLWRVFTFQHQYIVSLDMLRAGMKKSEEVCVGYIKQLCGGTTLITVFEKLLDPHAK